MSTDLRTALAMGQQAQRTGNLEQAEQLFRQVLPHAPRNPDLLHALGLVRMQRGHPAEGAKLIRNAISAGRDTAETWLNLAIALLEAGSLQPAASAVERSIKGNPDAARPYEVLGNILLRAGERRRAAGAFRQALKRDPQHLQVRFALGKLLHELGDHGNAEHELAECHRQAPEDNDIRYWYARVLVNNAGYAPARELFEALVDSGDPRYQWLLGSLASLDRDLGEPERGLARIEQQESKQALDWNLMSVKGSLLGDCGRREEALHCFRQALSMDGCHPVVWFELADRAPEQITDEDIGRMESLVDAETTGPEQRKMLHYALARSCRHRGEYGREMEHLDRANTLQRETVTYDAGAVEELEQARRELFGPSFLERARGGGRHDVAPIFVLGLPRTGSTWTETLIGMHSAVSTTGENQALRRALQRAEEQVADRKLEAVFADDVVEPLQQIAEDYLSATRETHGAFGQHFTDTIKSVYRYVGLLHAMFPRARFVCVHRDPLDLCLECYAKPFRTRQEFASDFDSAAHLMACFRRTIEWWKETGIVVHELSFESLLDDFENTARSLFDFLELEWEDQVLALHEDFSHRAGASAPSPAVRLESGHARVSERYGERLVPLQAALERHDVNAWRG